MKPYPLDLVVWNLGRIIIIGIIGPCNAAGGERGGERGATPRCSPKPTLNQPETNPQTTRHRFSFFSKKVDAEPNGVSLDVRAKPPPFCPPGFVSRRRGDLRTLQAARVPSAPSRAPRDGRTAPPRFAASRTGCQVCDRDFVRARLHLRPRLDEAVLEQLGGCGPGPRRGRGPSRRESASPPPSSLGGLEFGFTILV